MTSAGKASLDACIDAATAQHMRWTTGRQTEREYGIPAGLPLLAGWIHHYAIEAEMEG